VPDWNGPSRPAMNRSRLKSGLSSVSAAGGATRSRLIMFEGYWNASTDRGSAKANVPSGFWKRPPLEPTKS
jgi:hypothetical protein